MAQQDLLTTDTPNAGRTKINAQTQELYPVANAGYTFKRAVRVASTANVTIASALENSDTLDGVTLATGDRVLLKNQTAGAENGIYVVVASGAASRSADANTSALMPAGTLVYVNEGTANHDKAFALSTNDPITLGTTSLTFAEWPTAATSGVAVEEDGVQEGTGIDRFDFTTGLDLSVSGTQATVSVSGAGVSITVVALGSDVTNNNATLNTLQDVTGLSFPVTSGVATRFRFLIAYTAAATTTGSRWTINGPAITLLSYRSIYPLTQTAFTQNQLDAYDSPSNANSTSLTTGGNLATIEGIIVPSATGTVIARFASEVSGSAIVAKAGSTVEYW